jgi:alanyl-tRNA synthetase
LEKYGVNQLRQMFLDFFESKGHLVMKSFSLVPHNDKSLLLINAGMAPLKPYFTGAEIPPRKRVTTCQKCIRTGDIENVGHTSRHGTFFEMLGNFSFGDYFKREAIHWTWEFLTEVVGLDKDRLYPSVYTDDDEAFAIWRDEIGVPEERIYKFGKEDNFWEHGAGPCGPCSEVYYDRGEKYGCGKPDCAPGCDCDRYMEVWNDVFTQFENDGNGNYTTLKQKNIDTGMGLERLAVAVQDVDSMFDIDTIRALRDKVCEVAGKEYHNNHDDDVSIRVITDHIRSATFMISDGIMPSNEGRGYVLRRLIRRAARHGRLLGIQGGFLEKGYDVDEDGFNKCMAEQKKRAHDARETTNYMGADATVYDQIDPSVTTVFTGYDTLVDESPITVLTTEEEIVPALTEGQKGTVIVEKTPFYATMGGQVGDTGIIRTPEGEFRVEDTIKLLGGKEGHIGVMTKGMIRSSERAELDVDKEKREDTQKNHSATHLLQRALKMVLGDHVEQKGSYVSPTRCRFDFVHFKPMTKEEIEKVEEIVNREIDEGLDVTTQVMNIEDARKTGAMALFGEKYGDKVRVVSMGDFSKEFCGGTHVRNTAQIRTFKIISETGIAAGVRRIEALTGNNVFAYYRNLEKELNEVAEALKTSPSEALERVKHLNTEVRELNSQLESMKTKMAQESLGDVSSDILEKDGVKILCRKLEGTDPNGMRELSDQLKEQLGDCIIVLISVSDGRVNLLASASDGAVKKGAHAGNLIKEIAGIVGGKGGGRPNMAQAGGKDASKADEAIEKAKEMAAGQIG